MSGLTALSIAAASSHIQAKELSPLELTEAYLARIEQLNPKLNAYVAVTADRARADARAAEEEIGRGRYRGPLHGIPIALKDLVDTAGIETAGGAKVLRGRVPQTDAAVAARLRAAGSVLLGKTNTHELAFGATTNNPHFGPTRNPWNTEMIPGGSSGGSGAATAACLAAGTIGTDTGGSIRIPASLCGVVGFKPTYGRVSKRGILPMSWLVDHPGPIVRTVEDAAIMLQVLAGYDPGDYATVPMPVPDYRSALRGGVRELKVGIAPAHAAAVAPEVRKATDAAIAWFASQGAEVVEVDLPLTGFGDAFGVVIAESREAVEEHWRKNPEDFGEDVRAIYATPLPDAIGFASALRALYRLGEHYRTVMETVDVVVTPTTSIVAQPIGQETVEFGGRTFGTTNMLANLTSNWNVARLPVLSLPCGFTAAGLPIGLSIAARPFDEGTVFRAAAAYEAGHDWVNQLPQLG